MKVDNGYIDVQAIAHEAQEMRAQMVRSMVVAAAHWMRGLFSRHRAAEAV
ncbi:RSP_7527 family protein [Celeribacter litoreus]|nr:hypothetical protein [Celeribacter litoreus]